MVMVEVNEDKFGMDGYLHQNLTTAKNVIKKDWDMVFIVDGAEGSGKSVLAMQCAYYCDPTLNLDRIVFTPTEFKEAIEKAEPYTALIYDEAYTGLSARATMSTINRTLVGLLAEIRQKNLFIFVVMPTFFDLDKYVALWRSRALLNVYSGDNFERGYFKFFNKTKKKDLYILGKKFYNYNKPESNFIGRFSKFMPIDAEAYKKKKRDALMLREEAMGEAAIKKDFQEQLFERVINLPEEVLEKLNINTRCQIIGISKPTYYSRLQKYNEKDSLTPFS